MAFVTDTDTNPDPVSALHPDSVREIARRTRALLRVSRRNGVSTNRDLAYELSAIKLVLAVLDEQAHAAGVSLDALMLGENLADDLKSTVTALGLAAELDRS